MATEPADLLRTLALVRLEPFDGAQAERVAAWVHTPQEAYWLAPHTPPPITGDKIRGWQEPGRQPFLLVEVKGGEAVGYGELNVLDAARGEFWLGHLIVDPARRGRGFGTALTKLLLRQAFRRHAARRVTLVVFSDNHPAIACYQTAGMVEDGCEQHVFPPYQRQEGLLRMRATCFF